MCIDPASGQFRKIKDTDIEQNKDQSEDVLEDELEKIQKEVNNYSAVVSFTNNNLYCLLTNIQGFLAGFCLFIILQHIPVYTTTALFAQSYSQYLATIYQKLFLFCCAVCAVLSIYVLSIEVFPPLPKGTLFTELLIIHTPSHKKSVVMSSFVVRVLLSVQSAMYVAAFICCVVNSFADEYFYFNFNTSGSDWASSISDTLLPTLTRNVIVWHVLNGIRAFCCMGGWVTMTILIRTMRRQSEQTFNFYLKQQSDQ